MTVELHQRKNLKSGLFTGIYIIILLLCAFFIFKNPQRFWDMLPYMGAVVSIENNDPDYIHKITYDEFNKYASPNMKASMLKSDSFCINMSKNAGNFYQQLPFFKIKLLYVYVSWLLTKMGVPLFYSVFLPSLLSFIFVSLIIYAWLNKHYKPVATFILSIILVLLNINFDAFRIASPDAMACSFLLASAFFFSEKRHIGTCIMLLLAVLARPDHIFFTGFLCCLFVIFNFNRDKKNTCIYFSCIIISFMAVMMARWQSGGYDFYRMFYRSFIYLEEAPYSTDIHFNMHTYLTGIYAGLKTSLYKTGVYLLPLLLIFYRIIKKIKFRSQDGIWILAMLGSFALRIFVHPLFETRYIFAFLIVLTIYICIEAKKYGGRFARV